MAPKICFSSITKINSLTDITTILFNSATYCCVLFSVARWKSIDSANCYTQLLSAFSALGRILLLHCLRPIAESLSFSSWIIRVWLNLRSFSLIMTLWGRETWCEPGSSLAILRWMMWLLFKSLSCRLKLEFRPTLSSLLSVIALLPDPSLFVTFWRMMAC